MKIGIIIFLVLPIYLYTITLQQKEKNIEKSIVFDLKDKEILEQLFYVFKDDKNTPVSDLIVKVGTYFKETPYKAATLEINPDDEKLVINLREMDCTTYAENVLAISLTIKDGNPTFVKFVTELQNIRYRDGEIDGYYSRNHYFSDWIFENDPKGIVKSVSQEIAGTPYRKTINFMSTHPESYLQLKNHPEIQKIIAEREREISMRKTYYIPKEKIGEVEPKLNDGDIVGITSRVDGLDISHVGILVRKDGKIRLMHASTTAEKVVVSDNSLEEYLLKSKSVTGIMVARPQ